MFATQAMDCHHRVYDGKAVRTFFLATAMVALVSCRVDHDCLTNADCTDPDEACRRSIVRCTPGSNVVTLAAGHCRSKRAHCGTPDDCIETETCGSDNTCRPLPPGVCPNQQCPNGCEWGTPFPCACVCAVCPGSDGGT